MNKRSPALIIRASVFAVAAIILSGCTGPDTVRVATFNTALSRNTEGALHAAFATDTDAKARLVAEVLQRTRPDIVLLQEVDYDPTGQAYADFQKNYLGVSQNGAEPIQYEHVYAPPVNTGVLAEVDLDGDGKITRPNDCYGYGLFPGHYGMVVMSRFPIKVNDVVSFRKTPWSFLPGHLIPRDFYPEQAQRRLRLSSKTHADVPVLVGEDEVRLLISHPTPPVFDGPEDRNGRRNADEIAAWTRYIGYREIPLKESFFPMRDDVNKIVALSNRRFVVMGDLNADPNDGASRPGAAKLILDHPWINDSIVPTSIGAAEASHHQAGANLTHKSDPAADTSDWNDDPNRGSGNLRVDYVLPSTYLAVAAAGVYWPARDDPHAYLNKASDHKLVWIDLEVDEQGLGHRVHHAHGSQGWH